VRARDLRDDATMNLCEWRQVFKRAQARGSAYPHQLAFVLELPLRKLMLSPAQLAERLHLQPDSRVLEIGPGPGFFSVELAQRVPRGHLELFDIQHEMLAKARRKLQRAGLRNVDLAQGDARGLSYRDESFDVIVLVAVLGEVPDPPAALRESYRVLRRGGILSVTELPGDPDFTSLPVLRGLAAAAGFELAEHFGTPKKYTANFRKPNVS
jgi:ubiquinone/menaquinone biosynthesis C-methylase UbiE